MLRRRASPPTPAQQFETALDTLAGVPKDDEVIIEKSGRVRQAGTTETGTFITALKDRAEKSLYVFDKAILRRHLQPNLMSSVLHGWFCRWLQRVPPYRKMALLPRGHLKSAIVGEALPAHILIQPDPDQGTNCYWPGLSGADMRILLIGEKQDLMSSHLRWIETQFETNQLLRAFWPHRCWDNPRREAKKWNEMEMEVPRRGSYPDPCIAVTGVGGAMTGKHPNCIERGSLVYTSNGLQPIEEIEPHMRVLTSTGHHREVQMTQHRRAPDIVALKLWGQFAPIRCTPEHRVLAYLDNKLQWIESRKLLPGDLVALPIPSGRTRAVSRTNPRINKLVNDARCWKLLGYWLAEGAASPGTITRLTFSKHEEFTLAAEAASIVREVLGVAVSVKTTNNRTAVVYFNDPDFKEITRKFGTHAYNKHIPPFAIATKRHFRVELVRGYFLGDGCPRKTGGWVASSISPSLVAGLQLLLASLEIPAITSIQSHAGTTTFGDKTYNTKTAYRIQSNHPLMDVLMGTPARWGRNPCRSTIIPGYLLSQIREVQKIVGEVDVYDLQIAQDESFVVVGGCVHNCIIKDDIIALDAANSPTVMEAAWETHKTSRPLLAPHEDIGLEYIIGTHWAVGDIYFRIQQTDPSVECVVRSIIEDGKPIWEHMTLGEIDRLRKEYGALFHLLYMNSAANPELTDFHPEMLRFYKINEGLLEFDEDSRDLILADREGPAPARPAPDGLRGTVLTPEVMKNLFEGGERVRFNSR